MYEFLQFMAASSAMMELPRKPQGEFVKKTHLLTQPTRIQDINFDDLDEMTNSRWAERAEKSRIRSYRKLRSQEA